MRIVRVTVRWGYFGIDGQQSLEDPPRRGLTLSNSHRIARTSSEVSATQAGRGILGTSLSSQSAVILLRCEGTRGSFCDDSCDPCGCTGGGSMDVGRLDLQIEGNGRPEQFREIGKDDSQLG